MKLTCKVKGVDWHKFMYGMDAAFSSFQSLDSLETETKGFYKMQYEELDGIAPRKARRPREGSH